MTRFDVGRVQMSAPLGESRLAPTRSARKHTVKHAMMCA